MGLTETQAKADGIEYEKAIFPWARRAGRWAWAATRA